jgi:hypothetical protein
MKAVLRRIQNHYRSVLGLFLTLTLMSLPALVPLCSGANAAALTKHDCCQGRQTCHTQFQRSPCCEYQPSPGGTQPFTAGTHYTGSPVTVPALIATLPVEDFIPKLFRESEGLSRRAQGPPLYLQKQSLLC